MTLVTSLRSLIQELDRVHPNGDVDYKKLDDRVIPTFRTAENGEARFFTNAALADVDAIAELLYANAPALSTQVRIEEFTFIVLQAVADCHAGGDFDLSNVQIVDCKKALKARIDVAVDALRRQFTHYFPAWTLGAEQHQPFAVGPVSFLTREQWIASVQFAPAVLKGLAPQKGRRYDWKKYLDGLLQGARRRGRKSHLHDWVYSAIKDCPAVLKVDVSGSEIALSKQRARFACRTALDSTALLFGGTGEQHSQFVLHDERLQPIGISSLLETDGNLWLPGSSLRVRGWHGDAAKIVDIVKHGRDLLDACGKVIAALVDPKSCATPRLAQRWATALSVFGDGCRELQDGMAVAKLAASLDILSGGGEEAGILNMLLHLTRSKKSTIITRSPKSLTFAQVVKKIYSEGRSQYLHGNHVDPMKRFADVRGYAAFLARLALRETVLRWVTYTGPDEDKAFQTI
jgi:hypothetical protein